VVNDFYLHLSLSDFESAYALYSEALKQSNPFAAWSAGYSTTLAVVLLNAEPKSERTVGVTVSALDDMPEGTLLREFQGEWDLIVEGGEWRLDKGRLVETKRSLIAAPTTAPIPTLPSIGTMPPRTIESCIEGTFTGWTGDTLFPLCNGQLWIQTSYAYIYDYAYRPDVTIVPTAFGHEMFVDGVRDSVAVEQITDFVRTCIDGNFEGWEGDTIFPLCSGQVWQQASFGFRYHFAFRPDVLIYNVRGAYYMQVEGMDEAIRVRRLR
jgi:hypothetical protein